MDSDPQYEAGLSYYDDMARTWGQAVLGLNPEPLRQFRKFREEVDEVLTAESVDDMALELGDVVSMAIGLLHMHGHTLAEIMPLVFEKNYRNYPPEMMKQLVESGMTHEEALDFVKSKRAEIAGVHAPA